MTLTLIFLVASCLPSIIIASSYPPPEVNFSTHESLLEAAFDAIKYLHAQMDDDHSGSVDLAESSGFIKEELSQVSGSDAILTVLDSLSNISCNSDIPPSYSS